MYFPAWVLSPFTQYFIFSAAGFRILKIAISNAKEVKSHRIVVHGCLTGKYLSPKIFLVFQFSSVLALDLLVLFVKILRAQKRFPTEQFVDE